MLPQLVFLSSGVNKSSFIDMKTGEISLTSGNICIVAGLTNQNSLQF